MSIFLTGYRASGKTTIGRLLAGRLGMPFADLDGRIVEAAGKSIREIFEQNGEPYFRDLESRLMGELASLPAAHVIALGGGALMREENRVVVKSGRHTAVYLRCEAGVLFQRIHADPTSPQHRPHLTGLGGTLEEITALLTVREPIYQSMSAHQLDVTNLSAEQAVDRLAEMLH